MRPTFSDLSYGDMFNTKSARFVKVDNNFAIVVMSSIIPIGNIRPFDDDCDIVPLFQSSVKVDKEKVTATRIVDGPHTDSFLGQGFDKNGGLVISLSNTENEAVERVERILKVRNWELEGHKLIPFSSLQTNDIFETLNRRQWIRQEGTMALCIKDTDSISNNIVGKSRDLAKVADVVLLYRKEN